MHSLYEHIHAYCLRCLHTEKEARPVAELIWQRNYKIVIEADPERCWPAPAEHWLYQELVDCLIVIYDTRLLKFTGKLIKDQERTLEMLQQTWMQVFKHLPQFQAKKNCTFYTWICKIAQNEYRSFLRRRKNREDKEVPLEEFCNVTIPSAEHFVERCEMVSRVVSILSTKEIRLFLLKEVEGYTVAELSAVTGLAENTIKVQMFRVRKKIERSKERLYNAKMILPAPPANKRILKLLREAPNARQ